MQHQLLKKIKKTLRCVRRQAESDPSDQSDTIQLLCDSFLKATLYLNNIGEKNLSEILEVGLNAMAEDHAIK